MRHPALTRFLAAFLAVASAVTLLSGWLCVKKAADGREKQNTERALLVEKTAEAKALQDELDTMAPTHEGLEEDYDERSWQHAKDLLSYRMDLAMYTATEGGLKQGAEQIEEGYAELRMGWIRHDNALKALEEGEAKFRPGYEQYLEGKRQLEEGLAQLEQAEALKETLPDLAQLRAGLDALGNLSTMLSATCSSTRAVLQSPPCVAESDEIDGAALRGQLGAKVAALNMQVGAVQQASASAMGGAETEAAAQSAAAALGQISATLADGSLGGEELIASVSAQFGPVEALSPALNGMIAANNETLNMLENLPQTRAELEAAQAALRENEPALLEAKEQIEEGRRQLNTAKNMLIYAESQLIQGKKSLEEKQAEQEKTRVELDRRKTELEQEAAELETLRAKVERYSEKKDRFGNLRYALLADAEISAAVREGGELIGSAETVLAQRLEATEREYELRLAAAGLMLLAAALALLAIVAAFRDKTGPRLLLPAFLSFAAAAAAEGVSLYAGRGPIYTVLFVGLFALGIAALNLKKA